MVGESLSVESAVARFGVSARSKLAAVSVRGEPEDQLRAPLEALFADLAELCSLDRARLTLVGESSLAEMHTRPDFAVSYADALIGYIEVKAREALLHAFEKPVRLPLRAP